MKMWNEGRDLRLDLTRLIVKKGETLVMPHEALFEFHQVGAFMKVAALDPESGIEVSIMGPANASEHVLRINALRKLEAALRKRHAEKA
jgi:hypothetical protein